MDTDKPTKHRTPHRDEFEIAYGTKELGRTLQRKLFQQQMEASGSAWTAAHGEDSSFETHSAPPQHDRAG